MENVAMVAARELSSHAAAARAIRIELKKAFPGVKFSVRSSSFSMGDSVSIDWTDGPTTAAVDAITGKYQYGHFDGMIDMYENDNGRDDIPQAKYVQPSREYSASARENAKNKIMKDYGLTTWDDQTVMANLNVWADVAIYRELQDKTL
jgi:hypothetical protein